MEYNKLPSLWITHLLHATALLNTNKSVTLLSDPAVFCNIVAVLSKQVPLHALRNWGLSHNTQNLKFCCQFYILFFADGVHVQTLDSQQRKEERQEDRQCRPEEELQ